jgi:CubicO group peptidase (beta-lactamase class C family)
VKLAPLILSLLVAAAPAAEPARYLTGGSRPLDPALQARLDAHAPIVTLGLNTDWMEKAGVAAAPYVEAIDTVALAVRAGGLPGAVLHVASLQDTEMMPIGVGYLMTDPQTWPLAHDTSYELGSLTGPLVTVPVAARALFNAGLATTTTLATVLPGLAGTPLGTRTVEDVVGHRAGLPHQWEGAPATAEGVVAWIGAMPEDPSGHPSTLGFVLLARVAEALEKRPFDEQAKALLEDYWPAGITAFGLDPARRQYLAPGPYCDRLGHMIWGDPPDELANLLGRRAGHWGLVSTAGEVGSWGLIALWVAQMPPAPPNLQGPDAWVGMWADLIKVGGGMQRGRFGNEGLGWDTPDGCSFWILPRQQRVLVFLSNMDHPGGAARAGRVDPRDKVLDLLAQSAGWGRGGVDTPPSAGDHPRP